MARGFQEKEKEYIRNRLLHKGRELFSRYGLKKTSIAELTRAAGIAQGSFYLFYSTKEELYFHIMEQEEAAMKEQLHAQAGRTEIWDRAAFKRFLLGALRMVDDNAFLKSMLTGNEYEQLLRKLPPEKLENHIRQDEDALQPLLEMWRAKGIRNDVSPAVVSALLRAFFLLLLHEREIGEDLHGPMMDLMAECLAAGLVEHEREKEEQS